MNIGMRILSAIFTIVIMLGYLVYAEGYFVVYNKCPPYTFTFKEVKNL